MLNQIEKDVLQIILNNEPLLSVIRKVFHITIENEKPEVGKADNELIGQQYRSYETARKMIEQGFIHLMSYKINKNPVKDFSKER